MNINDILINSNRILPQNGSDISAISGKVQLNAADALLSDLKAGDSIQAQVVSKDGNVVTLQLPGNALVDAKVSGGMNLDIGKLLTFEVKSSSNGLMLSPLFTNMASDPNVQKALNMAGIPVTSESVEMTREMMSAGMSVDRNSLSAVFKDIAMNPGANVSDIVDLHRLGIEVNENNLTQIDSYKNLSYQIGEGMNGVLNDLSNALSESIASGNPETAGKLLAGLTELASEVQDNTSVQENLSAQENTPVQEGITASSDKPAPTVNIDSAEAKPLVMVSEDASKPEEALASTVSKTEDSELTAAERALKLLSQVSAEENTEVKSGSIQQPIKDNTPVITQETNIQDKLLPADENTRQELSAELSKFVDNPETLQSKSLSELFDITKNMINQALSEHDTDRLLKLVNNKTILGSVLGAINEQWSIAPTDVAEKEKVMELYSRLTRQLGMVKEALESAGLKNSPAGESASNMSNNLDFLNQVNQIYSYIQLPIKLSGGDSAHGDLYVYSNGKKLDMKDGKVSALLHLDMEHLGPVDVYVSMDTSTGNKKVNTQFYVADDSILDFIEGHMDELTQRLEAKGYSASARTSVKGSKDSADDPLSSAADGGGINGILSQNGGIKLSEYSFDVRT